MSKGIKSRLLLSLCAVVLLLPGSAASAAEPGSGQPAAAGAANLSVRMDRLEARLHQVEDQLTQLQREKQAVQAQLDQQKQEDAALKARLDPPVASPASFASSETRTASDQRRVSEIPSSEWGTRVGYQDFPYMQKHGGLFYSFYFDHTLVREADGIPFGDLGVDINVGIGRSGTDHINDFSDVLFQKFKLDYRQTMLSGWIGMKYQLNQWVRWGLRPYVIGGPGIWGDVVESPPVFIGQSLPSKVLSLRKLPVDAAASLYEGGQGGAGVEYNLARTGVPLLARVNLGFDYRYSAWTTGERFNTYTFSLSASE
jgi:hypothetical protein